MEKFRVTEATKIGRYEIRKTIGKGGMGEVLLAYDPLCEREVALKRIRPDLTINEALTSRFSREAKITAQLTHPGIISIYSIHEEYYVMPYVEGSTLKQLLSLYHKNPNDPKGSIPSLLPIFKSVCQTIAYAHARGFIHRDIKPENILVGKFGEVILLDWGLAQGLNDEPEELLTTDKTTSLTSPGKMVGTIAYMAPERALGKPANILTDVYALGVILYQILTLHFPFHRTSIKEFRKNHHLERLGDPEEIAPYRDVPPRLSQMVKLCLAHNPHNRYQEVNDLLHDLRSHMEGRSEWFLSATLMAPQKRHWEFQENVLISKNMAVANITEGADWVSVMISKGAFSDNTRLKTMITIGEEGAGIGILLSVPSADERENPLDGYCLWLGTDTHPLSQLFLNTVEVMHLPGLFLHRGVEHELIVERFDNQLRCLLDGKLVLTYVSYIPLFGTHVGLMARDADYILDKVEVFVGSHNLQVSCLSVPDAFLTSRDYKRALAEYRRIGIAFPGHAEGREALFRAGITLIEQAKGTKNPRRSESYYTLALEEFSKLHSTPGAPLEYLGKALVYQSMRDRAEEIKCLELGLRRYFKHPLVGALKDRIAYRMHEAASSDRRSAYQLILIALRLLPQMVQKEESSRLFKHVIQHWEQLPFLESPVLPSLISSEDRLSQLCFAIPLAFWLAAPYILQEIYGQIKDESAKGDILFSLYELGAFGLAHKMLEEKDPLFKALKICHTESLERAVKHYLDLDIGDMGVRELRTLTYLMRFALKSDQEEWIHVLAEPFLPYPLSQQDRIEIDAYRAWAYLKENQIQAAGKIFEGYPLEMLNQESTILHPLFGCYLLVTEGDAISDIHFAGVIDTPFPRTWALLGHQLTNNILESPSWYSTSFLWERRWLYQLLTLYYTLKENQQLETYYCSLEREEYIYVPE